MVLYCHRIHCDLAHWEMLPFLVLRKWYLAEHCFACLTGEDNLFGELWHFSSPHNHIEKLQDISEYSTFSCLIPRLISPTHYLIHTKTHRDIHTKRMCSDHRHTHRYTDTQRDTCTRYTHTQTHRGTNTSRHKDTGTRTDSQIDTHTQMPDSSPVKNRTERTVLWR